MKIRSKPQGWPYVPASQQIKGVEFITKHIGIVNLEWSMKLLIWSRMMSKARKHKTLRRYRKAVGLSYNDWRKQRPINWGRR